MEIQMCAAPRVTRVSILNDVLGPVMRGPSSSHTAGSYHIAKLVTGLFGATPMAVEFAFDPNGSYAQVYRQQGVDRALAVGVMGWSLTDDRFFAALDLAAASGLEIRFAIRPLAKPDHPNTVEISMRAADGRRLAACARSIGGGAIEVVEVDGWPVGLTGYTHEVLVDGPRAVAGPVVAALSADGEMAGAPEIRERGGRVLVCARRLVAIDRHTRAALAELGGDVLVREARAIAYVTAVLWPTFASMPARSCVGNGVDQAVG